MVHQHFMLVPPLTVTENIILGQETLIAASRPLGRLAWLDRRSAAEDIYKLSQQYGLRIDPDAKIQDLPVGAQQRVEIVKALYRKAEVLILDEPTAVLTPQEADEFFVIMRSLAEQGKSIVFITHKLREVLAVADRISVMRAGSMVGSVSPADATQEMLAEMMVGRECILVVDKNPPRPGEPVLSVQDLQVRDDRRHLAVNGVSFSVRAGEIFGIAGVQGNGQTELAEALTGLRPVVSGQAMLLNRDMTNTAPRKIREAGAAHIPEDRQKHGLVLSYPVRDNLVLCTYYLAPFAEGVTIDDEAVDALATILVQQFDVRTPGITTTTSSLSGGNQQKVIVARELSRPIKLLIASQPTRGLDVGSIEFIHHRIVEARDQGADVLLISAELDEIIALSDRIAVMYKGQILDILPGRDERREVSREKLGLLMAGITDDATETREVAHV